MKTNGKWKIKSSKEVYKNRWMKVREDQVICPNGKNGIYGLAKLLDGTCILAMDKNGFIFLVKQHRYSMGEKSIELPGGAIENGRSPFKTAELELKEEAGITAKNWKKLGKIHPITSAVKATIYLYLAQNLKVGKSCPDDTESFELMKVPFEDAVKMVIDGKITHSPSCVLILKAKEYFKNNVYCQSRKI